VADADINVTDKVDFGNPDDESLPLTRCVCGASFEIWTVIISIYRDDAYECPSCKRRLYFSNCVQVFEVHE